MSRFNRHPTVPTLLRLLASAELKLRLELADRNIQDALFAERNAAQSEGQLVGPGREICHSWLVRWWGFPSEFDELRQRELMVEAAPFYDTDRYDTMDRWQTVRCAAHLELLDEVGRMDTAEAWTFDGAASMSGCWCNVTGCRTTQHLSGPG